MRFLKLFLAFAIIFSQFQSNIPTAQALGSTGVVIAQVYPGSTGVATQEFVELYNNGSQPVDVTGWCLNYISSSAVSTTKLGCLSAPDISTKLWVKAGGYIKVVSNEYQAMFPGDVDILFAGGMATAAGHVRLVDSFNTEIDRIGWGSAANPETSAATAPANTKSLQRLILSGGMQDTDNNFVDFEQVTPILHSSDVFEVVTTIDVCPNIDGAQSTMPVGYLADVTGDCQPDSCLNIVGLQVSVPDGFDGDMSGNCLVHDECTNVGGIQVVVPNGMIRGDENDCDWDIVPIVVTEVLPNAVGSDTGNEFIEIYNPTDRMVDLGLYSVRIGTNQDKTLAFPVGATIAPGEYRSFSDSTMKFTLVNTTSRVTVNAVDGSTVGDSGNYDSPPEGESWALIEGNWQYTNQPTPGSPNVMSVTYEVDTVDATDTVVASCPAGKYRNPLTNRCRNIVSDVAVLASCDSDQYRNPESGRCRKIITTTVTACKDGQYRSEETNRCRSIIVASTQKPCTDSQYRSEETGRCRNALATSIPAAAFAVKPVEETGMAFVGWWALAGVGAIALGYAGWEWRQEVVNTWQKTLRRFGSK